MPYCSACRILVPQNVPQPGMEPVSPAVEGESYPLDPREVPSKFSLFFFLSPCLTPNHTLLFYPGEKLYSLISFPYQFLLFCGIPVPFSSVTLSFSFNSVTSLTPRYSTVTYIGILSVTLTHFQTHPKFFKVGNTIIKLENIKGYSISKSVNKKDLFYEKRWEEKRLF